MKPKTTPMYNLALRLMILLTTGSVTSSVHTKEVTSSSVLTKEDSDLLLEEVTTALEKAVNFFSEDYSAINLDGVFGLSSAQGTLIRSLEWCRTSNCPERLVQRMEKLEQTINATAAHALPYVKSEDEAYYNRLHKLIDSPFLLEPRNSSLDEGSETSGTKKSYNETDGDRCLALLLGSYGDGSPHCAAPDHCITMMTKPDQEGYSITHQLLYFMIAEKEKCQQNISARLTALGLGDVKSFQRQLCSHIYADAKGEVINGSVTPHNHDLFLEQGQLCSQVGFYEFFRPEWVRMVLRMQTWRGCFKTPWTTHALGNAVNVDKDDAKKMTESQHSVTQRKLLRDKPMEDGCSSHMTGLGICLLAEYQRHLIENNL